MIIHPGKKQALVKISLLCALFLLELCLSNTPCIGSSVMLLSSCLMDFVPLFLLYMVKHESDTNTNIKARTGNLLCISLVQKQSYMQITREDGKLGSV